MKNVLYVDSGGNIVGNSETGLEPFTETLEDRFRTNGYVFRDYRDLKVHRNDVRNVKMNYTYDEACRNAISKNEKLKTVWFLIATYAVDHLDTAIMSGDLYYELYTEIITDYDHLIGEYAYLLKREDMIDFDHFFIDERDYPEALRFKAMDKVDIIWDKEAGIDDATFMDDPRMDHVGGYQSAVYSSETHTFDDYDYYSTGGRGWSKPDINTPITEVYDVVVTAKRMVEFASATEEVPLVQQK